MLDAGTNRTSWASDPKVTKQRRRWEQFIETLEKENSLYVHSGWGFLLPGRWHEAELLSSPFVSSPHNHTASCTKKHVLITQKAKSTQRSLHQKSKACLMWKHFYINTGINLTSCWSAFLLCHQGSHSPTFTKGEMNSSSQCLNCWLQIVSGPLGCLLWSFPLRNAVTTQSDETPDQRTGDFAHKDIARCIRTVPATTTDIVIRNIRNLWLQRDGNWVCSFCLCHWFMVSTPGTIHDRYLKMAMTTLA